MNTDSLFRSFCHLFRDGTSLAAALKLEGVPESSYYKWRKARPDLEASLKNQAKAQVSVEIDLERARAERVRETRRQRIEESLLDGVAPVIQQLLEAAKSSGSLHEQVAVLRELRQWLSAGVLGEIEDSAAEEPLALMPSLPDFLAGGQVSKVSVESPSGDKVILERGQVLDGAISEKPAPV